MYAHVFLFVHASMCVRVEKPVLLKVVLILL